MRKLLLLALGTAVLLPIPSGAQSNRQSRVSAHALLGVFAPTGGHRSVLGDAFAIGGQLGVAIAPSWAAVGGALISQTSYRDRLLGDVTLVQYDLGLEYAPAAAHGTRWRVVPFVGRGAGARTYDRTEGRAAVRAVLAGYGSLGGEIGFGHTGVRFEARDYLSRSEAAGTATGARNDVTAVAGLAYHFR